MIKETQTKAVYTIIERDKNRSRWVRIGIGFVNRDGSINIRLDAVPVNGRLHVRDYQRAREEQSEPPIGDARQLGSDAALDQYPRYAQGAGFKEQCAPIAFHAGGDRDVDDHYRDEQNERIARFEE